MQMRKLAVLSLVIGALVGACSGDPNDPMTWARKLKNVRDQQEALNQLARMGAERAKVAVPALIELYKETKKPEHLEALVRYKDPSTVPLFVDAMEFTEDDFDRAIVAAGALGEMREQAKDAVPSLIKAVEHPLPIKSRANGVRLASIRALVKIGDARAVPTLSKILTTSADEQDFLLNQKAALGLAELHDPAAVPALIKGMFMTGRGANIFHECRLGLVRIGEPAVAPLVVLLAEKDAEINALAKKLDFDKYTPGIVRYKAAILLGDTSLGSQKGPHTVHQDGSSKRRPLIWSRGRVRRVTSPQIYRLVLYQQATGRPEGSASSSSTQSQIELSAEGNRSSH